jgi:pantoate kinase
LRGSKGVGVTIESYGKVEISYKRKKENNNNKKQSKHNKSPNVVGETKQEMIVIGCRYEGH